MEVFVICPMGNISRKEHHKTNWSFLVSSGSGREGRSAGIYHFIFSPNPFAAAIKFTASVKITNTKFLQIQIAVNFIKK